MTEEVIAFFNLKIEMYLMEMTDSVILCVFDARGEIIKANDNFKDLFFPADPSKEKIYLEDMMFDREKEEFSLPENEDYIRQKIKLKRDSGTPYFADCLIFSRDDSYLLIGESKLTTSDDALKKISKLNNELANKTRELSKKNKELKKTKAEIEKIMRTDKLTDLANRRAFMEFLGKMLAQVRRYDISLTILMLDLDDFKDINDNYGHVVGDRILREVGKILAQKTREGDMAARLGGDEFAVLLVETNADEAVNIAQRFIDSVKNIEIESREKPLTLSLGITEVKDDESIESLLARADKAMYKAKYAGKDNIARIE